MLKASALRVLRATGTPPTLREQKRAELHFKIYKRALQLFRQRGYEGTRVEDIARDLEIGPATFFRYFPAKDALLHEYQSHFYARINEVNRVQLSSNANTAQRLSRMYETLAGEMEADRPVWQAMESAGLTNPWRSPESRAVDKLSRDLLEATIAKGQKRGDVDRSIPAALLAQFMEGLATAIISNWAAAATPYPLAGRFRSAVAFFLARTKL